ncbi:MAG: glycosyltransferase [Alphaproteobacteria bacterium]
MSIQPRLSICVATYNHEKYIAEALESFLQQKTNFSFQIIIGDDASTDSTPQILREYATKYPDIIKPILREKNISPIKNSLDIYSRAKTEFVAICDGDDFWTNKNKLQRQVDYLDVHPECAITYHKTCIRYADGSHDDIEYPSPTKRFDKTILTLEDLAVRNPMHTSSLVYRWRFQSEDIRKFMPDDICPGDYFLALLHAETGNIAFIDSVMSVYRVHSGGMSFGIHKKRYDLVWLQYGLEELNFHRAVDTHFNSRLHRYFRIAIEKKSRAVLDAYLQHRAFDKLATFSNEHPKYYEMAIDYKKQLEQL